MEKKKQKKQQPRAPKICQKSDCGVTCCIYLFKYPTEYLLWSQLFDPLCMLKSILGEILKPELPSMLSLECERVNVRYSEHSDIEKSAGMNG